MDDQFNGRTDDDLFADDFEPVAPQLAEAVPAAAPAAAPTAQNTVPAAQTTVPTQSPQPPPRLAQSRHNKPANPRPPRHQQATRSTTATEAVATPSTAPAGPKSDNNAARLLSGANPRTKLTDEELNAKMEQMRIQSAEKARRFEKAQRDELAHNVAYEKGMEEARKRKAVEEEKRRRGEEDRRRMEDERAKNRERKLKAMGAKEGGWDEGKEAEEQQRGRGGFRGAHGGVRGAAFQSTGKITMDRFLTDMDAPRDFGQPMDPNEPIPVETWGHDEFRGRGRGPRRGGPGRGRGGGRGGSFADRNGSHKVDQPQQQQAQAPKAVKPPKKDEEEYPTLPARAKDKAGPAPLKMAPLPGAKSGDKPKGFSAAVTSPLTPIGKWDEEVTASIEKNAAAGLS
jgi:hypothetical protein